jgi:hypothetical protein
MQSISPDDPRLIWSGAISLEQKDGWVKPWRVPHDELDLYSPGEVALAGRAELPSGVRLRFATDSQQISLHTEATSDAGSLDLYADGSIADTVTFAEGQSTISFGGLAAGVKTIEIWLSPYVAFKLRRIELDDGAQLEKSEDPRPKWVTYGSSITHCRAAGSPSFTWPGVVARARNLNLTSLGYGGQCHADPMIARLIRDLPADFVSVKLGINIYGAGSLSARSFRPAVLGTIATIRDGHPDIPLAVCSPIWSPERERAPNKVELSLTQMRLEIAAAVESFRRRGDENIHYIDGLKLLDSSLAEHLPDNVHPSAEGYRIMGANFLREVFEVQGVTL